MVGGLWKTAALASLAVLAEAAPYNFNDANAVGPQLVEPFAVASHHYLPRPRDSLTYILAWQCLPRIQRDDTNV
ncbi:hypothetical protein HDK90DRAFT_485841 [Phyllosticta capitalensis]|uniref:Uncharacterized protein n=1 Tax=Phyllosticta capitalensis TaxID=121624 RepID=A0ABR1YQW3_9PEZI